MLNRMAINIFLIFFIIKCLHGHGRLMDPPSRNAMWRYGYSVPINYNDNELFCGGRTHQWSYNNGKCGICGDPYDKPKPRMHEAGGVFGLGIVTRSFIKSQSIPVSVELTANHMGHFIIKLCASNNPYHDPDQECFDKYPLIVSGSNSTKYIIKNNSKKQGFFNYFVDLPLNVTCSHCILQWTYYTANNWGQCADNSFSVACGEPEIFRNCADIKIEMNDRVIPPHFARYIKKLNILVKEQVCISHVDRNLDDWCQYNCINIPRFCPKELCICPTTCKAINSYENEPGADAYCLDTCLRYPPVNCSATMCECYAN